MSDLRDANSGQPSEVTAERASSRISVQEIVGRLNLGRLAVYSMLEQGIMPGIRLGQRWIITRHAYEQWERTCGRKLATACEEHQRSTQVKSELFPND